MAILRGWLAHDDVMTYSSPCMAGSGFVAVGFIFAVILRKWGFSEWDSINYGMIGGACVLIGLFVALVVYVAWRTVFGPDEPA